MGDADGGGTERAPRANAEAFVASIILSSRADCSASLASRLPASHSMAKATVLPGFPGWGGLSPTHCHLSLLTISCTRALRSSEQWVAKGQSVSSLEQAT